MPSESFGANSVFLSQNPLINRLKLTVCDVETINLSFSIKDE